MLVSRIVSRIVLSTCTQGARAATVALRRPSTGERPDRRLASLVTFRELSINAISSNISLITTDRYVRLDADVSSSTSAGVVLTGGKPLVVILTWLKSKPSHVMKYATLYLDRGFDVLTVRVHLWQCYWPAYGAQAVATELLEFLRLNYTTAPLMLHGFSVGGYLWGEVCCKASDNSSLYRPVLDRVVGQVWDSVVLLDERSYGMSLSIFPRSPELHAVFNRYTKLYFRVFHEFCTKHHIRAYQMLRTNMVGAPALFLVSINDPLSTVEGNRSLHDSWASMGMQTYWKCWDKSTHVGHYRMYPEEYVAELFVFLDKLQFVQIPDTMRAVM